MEHQCVMCSYYGPGQLYKMCSSCASAYQRGVADGEERGFEAARRGAVFQAHARIVHGPDDEDRDVTDEIAEEIASAIAALKPDKPEVM